MKFLPKNLNAAGRIFRLAIGLILLVLSYWYTSIILLVLALFTFFEALMSWCIVYQLLGKNSCPINNRKDDE